MSGKKLSGELSASSGQRPAKTSDHDLCRLVGAYACSTRNIDRLVDLAREVPGVYGAQLAGAGLGGCVMILARRQAAARVKSTLARAYYQPLGIAPAVWQVRPVAGGGVIRP